MRVLQLMSCRGWSSDAYWAGQVTRELRRRGHHVTFVARAGTEAKVLSRLRALGVEEIATAGFEGLRSPAGSLRDLAAIRRWQARHDVVHVHRGREHWLAAMAGTLLRHATPLVRTRHIVQPVSGHAGNRWLYRRATAHVIAVSEAIRTGYLASGLLPAARVTAVPGGVDARRFHPGVCGADFRQRHALGEGKPVVGVLAGLRPMKGHDVFLQAARRVLERRSDARFVIVGTGPGSDDVRGTVRRLGLGEHVTVAGFDAAPPLALAAFDVAVYASRTSEGMSRVLFEYMAAGRPIVATSVGLAPEVLRHGETARLVPPADPAAMAEAILGLLAEPRLAAEAGRACRVLVEARYSAERVAEAVEQVYRAVCAERGGGASPG